LPSLLPPPLPQMNEDTAATTMAAAQRGNQARKERAEQKQAATRVGAGIRGRNARKEQKQQQQSAVAIQSRIRGQKSRTRAPTGEQRFYTPSEIAMHDRADDLWVTFFHKVYDLSELVKDNVGHLVQPLIDAAGTDITHWFDPDTKEPRKHIDPETELETFYLPMGPLLHCIPPEPTAAWSTDIGTPWWKGEWNGQSLFKGKLTIATRKIKLFNMLTRQETTLEVCCEETLLEIQKRYLPYNEHAASYTWKRTDTKVGRILDMMKTLDENGIPDQSGQFDMLDIDEDYYVPIIHLYFSDDLTIA